MARTIGEKLLGRLAAFSEALQKNESIEKRFTCRTIELNIESHACPPASVKATREALGLSQALFARFLGVSVKSVSAWEQGAKSPSDLACRWMDEIRRDPDYWRQRIRDLAQPRASA